MAVVMSVILDLRLRSMLMRLVIVWVGEGRVQVALSETGQNKRLAMLIGQGGDPYHRLCHAAIGSVNLRTTTVRAGLASFWCVAPAAICRHRFSYAVDIKRSLRIAPLDHRNALGMLVSRRSILRRGGALVGLTAIGLRAASPARAQASAPSATARLTVALNWLPNVEYAGLWIAMEKGYFRDEGLEVGFQPGGPNAPLPLVTVAAGNAQIGYANWLPFLDAIAKGHDFVLIGTTFPNSPLGILSLAAKPIRRPADLVGTKVLVQGPSERAAVEATLLLNNLPKRVEFVQASFSPEPLLSRQGDGYTAFATNQPITLERMGLRRDKDFPFLRASHHWAIRPMPTVFLRLAPCCGPVGRGSSLFFAPSCEGGQRTSAI
jgi:hypothetical protein